MVFHWKVTQELPVPAPPPATHFNVFRLFYKVCISTSCCIERESFLVQNIDASHSFVAAKFRVEDIVCQVQTEGCCGESRGQVYFGTLNIHLSCLSPV